MYLIADIRRRLATAILVYGTVTDAGANRYAAEQLQKNFLDRLRKRDPDPQRFRSDARPSCARTT